MDDMFKGDLEGDLGGKMEGDSKGDLRGDMEGDLLSSSGQVCTPQKFGVCDRNLTSRILG